MITTSIDCLIHFTRRLVRKLKKFSSELINKILLQQSIYKFGLSVCVFASNKRQNGWTDRAQIFCGTSRDHMEGLWMIKISNICLRQNSIFIKFLKILKIHEIFVKIRELFLFCFTMYTKRTCSQLILKMGAKASFYIN